MCIWSYRKEVRPIFRDSVFDLCLIVFFCIGEKELIEDKPLDNYIKEALFIGVL